MPLVVHEQRETMIVDGGSAGANLWTTPADIERATGWALKPEGLCRDEICIPLSPARRAALVRDDAGTQRVNLSELWRGLGHPVASDAGGDTWVLGTGANERADALRSLEAPDFTLPDLEGKTHTLSQLRGKKVFLATWASW